MRKAGFDLHEINKLYWKSKDTKKKSYKKGKNDSVEFIGRQAKVYLHGNQIASVNLKKNRMALSSAGWETPTTKTRLNKLIPKGYITQKKYHWYYETPERKLVPFKNWMSFKTR